MAIVPQLLIECGWSTRDRPNHDQWISKSGVRTTGDPRYGVPYRFDRVIVLYLATKAARRGAAFRGDLHELTELFDVRWRPDTALRRLRRVACCWYERLDNLDDEICRRTVLVQRLRIDTNQQFSVTLSDEFMIEIEQGAPISLPIVRQLAERPGTLDLYLWQASMIHRRQAITVSIFAPNGPLAVLPSAVDRSRTRQDICNRQAEIRQIWKECPYRISSDGTMLIYEPATTTSARAPQPAPLTASEADITIAPATIAAMRQLRDTMRKFIAPTAEPTPEPTHPDQPHDDIDPGPASLGPRRKIAGSAPEHGPGSRRRGAITHLP